MVGQKVKVTIAVFFLEKKKKNLSFGNGAGQGYSCPAGPYLVSWN